MQESVLLKPIMQDRLLQNDIDNTPDDTSNRLLCLFSRAKNKTKSISGQQR